MREDKAAMCEDKPAQIAVERMALRMQPRSTYYILEGRFPVACNFAEWDRMFKNDALRRVARTVINNEISVSTVFLGMDHNLYDDQGPPTLFESMTFGGKLHEAMWRYSTYAEAEVGHGLMVQRVKESLEDD